MFAHLKSEWRRLKNGEPGYRFRERYNHRRAATKDRFSLVMIANIALGLVLAIVGAIFLPAPGPGSIVLVMGLCLLGSEIQLIARFMDWLEVFLQKAIRWAKTYWRQSSIVSRSAVCAIGAATAGVSGYVIFQWYAAL